VLPLVVVFAQTFSRGSALISSALSDPGSIGRDQVDAYVRRFRHLNLIFGLVAAWAIAQIRLSRKTFLISLIDFRFSVSP